MTAEQQVSPLRPPVCEPRGAHSREATGNSLCPGGSLLTHSHRPDDNVRQGNIVYMFDGSSRGRFYARGSPLRQSQPPAMQIARRASQVRTNRSGSRQAAPGELGAGRAQLWGREAVKHRYIWTISRGGGALPLAELCAACGLVCTGYCSTPRPRGSAARRPQKRAKPPLWLGNRGFCNEVRPESP